MRFIGQSAFVLLYWFILADSEPLEVVTLRVDANPVTPDELPADYCTMMIPDKIEVRKGGLKFVDLFYLGVPAALIALSLREEDSITSLIGVGIFGSIFIYFAHQMIVRFTSKEVTIEFSDSAINLLEERVKIPWTRISAVNIKRGNAGIFDAIDEYLLLTIESKAEVDIKTIDIGDCRMNKKLVLEYCRMKISQHFDPKENSYCG